MQTAMALRTHARDRLAIQQAIKRVKKSIKKPKHDIFYPVAGLCKWAFQNGEQEMEVGEMVDKLLMQIRLGTLMRSGDAANIVWALFEQEGGTFIKTTDNKG